MSLDRARFRSRESRGIHEDAAGYREWARYARELEQLVVAHDKATAHLSFLRDDTPTYVEALALARQRPEDAVHVLVHLMMSGARWSHQRIRASSSNLAAQIANTYWQRRANANSRVLLVDF